LSVAQLQLDVLVKVSKLVSSCLGLHVYVSL
jgi:hypothetical protein